MLKQNIAMIFNIAVVNAAQVKLLNRKIEIEIQVLKNKIRNEVKVKTNYWYEC